MMQQCSYSRSCTEVDQLVSMSLVYQRMTDCFQMVPQRDGPLQASGQAKGVAQGSNHLMLSITCATSTDGLKVACRRLRNASFTTNAVSA